VWCLIFVRISVSGTLSVSKLDMDVRMRIVFKMVPAYAGNFLVVGNGIILGDGIRSLCYLFCIVYICSGIWFL